MPQDFYDYEAIDRERLEEAKRRNAVADEQERRAQAEAKERVDDTSRRANQSVLRFEYDQAGVAPPFTDGNGNPTVSLTLLKWMGWRVENYSGQNTLVQPLGHTRRRSEDNRENS